jgi:hypothetical protein
MDITRAVKQQTMGSLTCSFCDGRLRIYVQYNTDYLTFLGTGENMSDNPCCRLIMPLFNRYLTKIESAGTNESFYFKYVFRFRSGFHQLHPKDEVIDLNRNF